LLLKIRILNESSAYIAAAKMCPGCSSGKQEVGNRFLSLPEREKIKDGMSLTVKKKLNFL